jgi:hypothetical protein
MAVKDAGNFGIGEIVVLVCPDPNLGRRPCARSAAAFSAAVRRRSSSLRRLKLIPKIVLPNGLVSQCAITSDSDMEAEICEGLPIQ